jgi:hypothetical protein
LERRLVVVPDFDQLGFEKLGRRRQRQQPGLGRGHGGYGLLFLRGGGLATPSRFDRRRRGRRKTHAAPNVFSRPHAIAAGGLEAVEELVDGGEATGTQSADDLVDVGVNLVNDVVHARQRRVGSLLASEDLPKERRDARAISLPFEARRPIFGDPHVLNVEAAASAARDDALHTLTGKLIQDVERHAEAYRLRQLVAGSSNLEKDHLILGQGLPGHASSLRPLAAAEPPTTVNEILVFGASPHPIRNARKHSP